MISTIGSLFINMVGTLAVLLVIAFFVAGSEAIIESHPCFVLGGMEGVRYKAHTVCLKPTDKLFLYTDGVTEAENAARELYGNARLIECLKGAADQDVDQILKTVRESVEEHVKEADQFDDITMFCMEYKGV